MGWRLLSIENAGKLSLKDSQLIFKSLQEQKSVPIEDLEFILLEHQRIEITHPLLSKLAEEGVILVTCNTKYQANGILVSYWGQYKKLEVLDIQLSVSEPLKKRLWQKIISQKISNQALCLDKLNVSGSKEIKLYIKQVLSGDSSNTEGYSAALYFKKLFEKIDIKFVRQQYYDQHINLLNAGLNYCYAIIRSLLTRYVTTSGLLPYLGIHHASKVNAFNLVDDLIEPYRPMVDYHVHQYLDYLCHSKDEKLSTEIRRELQLIFTYQVLMDNQWMKLSASCRTMCYSLINSFKDRNVSILKIPEDWKQK